MRLTWRRADGAVCPRVKKGTDCHYIAGEFTQKVYDKLAAYEDAEEQGLLVRLPCKVGDTVYIPIEKCRADFHYCPFNGGYGTERCDGYKNCKAYVKEQGFSIRDYPDMGKTVFLTREEGEAALKGESKDV